MLLICHLALIYWTLLLSVSANVKVPVAIPPTSIDLPRFVDLTDDQLNSLASSQLEQCLIKYSAKSTVTKINGKPSSVIDNLGVFRRRGASGTASDSKNIAYPKGKATPSIKKVGYTPLKASRFTTFWTVDVFTFDGQRLRLMYDSGSSVTIVNPGSYMPSSKSNTGFRYDISYMDGSNGGGPVYSEMLSIGGLTVPTTIIMSEQTVAPRGADGVLGVGFSDSTVAASLVEAMVQNFTLATNIISMTMSNNGHGALTLGTIDANIINVLEYTDILTKTGHVWDVSMSINGLPSFTAFIDTGTTYLYLPMAIAENLFKQWGLRTEQIQKGDLNTLWAHTDCHKPAPKVYIQVGSSKTKFMLNASTVIAWTGHACRLSIIGANIKEAIVGATFLKNVHVVFDRDQYKLGFAQRHPALGEFTHI